MRFALFFLLIAATVYVIRQVLTKRERRQASRLAAGWIVPLAIAAIASILLLLFALHFNGKIL